MGKVFLKHTAIITPSRAMPGCRLMGPAILKVVGDTPDRGRHSPPPRQGDDR